MPMLPKEKIAESSAPKTHLLVMPAQVYSDLQSIVMDFVSRQRAEHQSKRIQDRNLDELTRALRVKDAVNSPIKL